LRGFLPRPRHVRQSAQPADNSALVEETGAIMFNATPMPTPPSANSGSVISFFWPLIEV
jgi:hypothetical protein